MPEEKIHINSFKFYDRDELEDLAKHYFLVNQQLKEQLEASEKARKDVYDYINFLVIIDTQLAGGRFKDTIWGKELLEILDIDKGEMKDE